MKSTKLLMMTLQEQGFITYWHMDPNSNAMGETELLVKSRQLNVSNETYGRKSMLYITGKDIPTAMRAAGHLTEAGFKCDFSWTRDRNDRFQVQVSYFKGARYWE